MDDALQSLTCGQCGGGPLTDNLNGTVSCPYCGSTFAHPERTCPCCETVNEQDARECVACGAKLKEPCVRCGTMNWVNAAYCRRCGAALNILEHIAARRAQTDADRLSHIQAQAARLKEETERASQRRMEEMWAIENQRLETFARNKIEQRRQERLIWAVTVMAIAALVIIVVALTVIAQLQAH